MSDKPTRKRGRKRLDEPAPGDIRMIEDRLGVVLTPQQKRATASEDEHQACAFCGRTDGAFRQLFDATHSVTICMVCLESVEDD